MKSKPRQIPRDTTKNNTDIMIPRIPKKRGRFFNRTSNRSVGPSRNQIQEFLFQWIDVLPENEAHMLRGIFSLSTTTAREVMVPLSELMAVHITTSTEELKGLVQKSSCRYLPVYEERLDRLTGIVSILEILYAPNPSDDLTSHVRHPYYIPETKLASDLLEELRKSEDPVAIVIDEHGGCVGFITFEDVLEVIIGDITCNFKKNSMHIEIISPDAWIVDARASINSINQELGTDIPKDRCDTIGGFILKLLGRLPEQGEKISFSEIEFTVEEVFGYGISILQAKRIKSDFPVETT